VKTTNISFQEAEEIEQLPDNTCLISIGNEHDEFWDLKVSGERVLKVVFSDITAEREYSKRVYYGITMEQAEEIVAFIDLHKEKDFIVNCHAGISRSGAVCLFIHKTYGHSLKPMFWALSDPNPLVFGRLTTAHALTIEKQGQLYSQSEEP
jgi:predicted protein tyrosine phosphatase